MNIRKLLQKKQKEDIRRFKEIEPHLDAEEKRLIEVFRRRVREDR